KFRTIPSPLYGIFPWRFLVVTDDRTKTKLGKFGQETASLLFGLSSEIMRGHLWYISDKRVQEKVRGDSATGELWNYPGDSSFVIMPCWSRGAWGSEMIPFVTIPVPHVCSAMIGMACQSMWLTTTELGYACALNAMPTNDPRRREMVADRLGIPHSWEFLGAFSFGVPRQPRYVGPARAPLEGVFYEELWGNNYVRLGYRSDKLEFEDTPEMELEKAQKKQASIGIFKEDPVEDWKIEKIMDVAKWAPNPENLQHWRFVVVRKDENFKNMMLQCNMETMELGNAMGITTGGTGLTSMMETYKQYMKYPAQADTVIIPCYTHSSWIEYPASTAGMTDYIFAGATGCCIENMWLAAIALGLGCNYDIHPVIENRRKELMCDYLNIPRSWEPLGCVYIGYPDKKMPAIAKPKLKDYVYIDHWGDKLFTK
ncbi:MAG: nitroreductase family protein, partial [Candidatus Helarchaeota archaeon]|nr:nitroreductase family protein [Candidatus Helarchaeota archaeon]